MIYFDYLKAIRIGLCNSYMNLVVKKFQIKTEMDLSKYSLAISERIGNFSNQQNLFRSQRVLCTKSNRIAWPQQYRFFFHYFSTRKISKSVMEKRNANCFISSQIFPFSQSTLLFSPGSIICSKFSFPFAPGVLMSHWPDLWEKWKRACFFMIPNKLSTQCVLFVSCL